LRVEREGVRACTDDGGDDDINGDVARAHRKGDDTDFRHHIAPTIKDQLARIRVKELNIEVHEGAVVQGHDQAETLLDQDAVTIHIGRIKKTPSHGDTITDKQIAEELGGEKGRVRFLLSHQHTATARGVPIVLVSATRTPCHGSSDHEDADQAYPPPASVYHGFPF
jgi:hypothetical protein